MIDVSVVMPCLNEEATVGSCIELARRGLERAGLSGEIVVADNGSTDHSAAIAQSLGARVVPVAPRGYGHAYRGGIAAARGHIIVIGDSDGTYDFSKLEELLRPFKDGAELVLGSRLRGSIERGAMPWLHRYVGNPFLSALLNRFYRTRISDTHTGFRALTRAAYDRMGLRAGGMEFASEMLIVAAQSGMRIVEVPVSYQPRSGESKLRSFRDGWRHLRLLLLYSPRHLFTIPGTVMAALGLGLLLALLPGPIWIRGRVIDYHFMFVGALLAILGVQVATLGLFAHSRRQAPAWFTLERGLFTGLVVLVAGLGANAYILWDWIASGFGALNAVRAAIFALTLIVVGTQVLFSSFYLDLLRDDVGNGATPPSQPGRRERAARHTARP